MDYPIERFDSMLRSIVSFGLAQRNDADGPPTWQFVPEAQQRLEQLARESGLLAVWSEARQMVYLDRHCALCGNRVRTRLRDGMYLCDQCDGATSNPLAS